MQCGWISPHLLSKTKEWGKEGLGPFCLPMELGCPSSPALGAPALGPSDPDGNLHGGFPRLPGLWTGTNYTAACLGLFSASTEGVNQFLIINLFLRGSPLVLFL